MTDTNNMIPPGMIQRNTMRLVEGDSLIRKPTLGKMFMMGLKRVGGVLANVAASVLNFFPGGKIAAAGLYGLGRLANNSYANDVRKRQEQLNLDSMAAQMNPQLLTPGFGMFGSPSPMIDAAPTGGTELQKWNTLDKREGAARSALDGFSIS